VPLYAGMAKVGLLPVEGSVGGTRSSALIFLLCTQTCRADVDVVPPLTSRSSWAVEGAQEQVDRDTPVSRTPTVAPGSLARERTLLRERRARGPQKLLGPPTARVNTRSEDHVKMQRPRMRGTTAAGETKRRATL
jgi:hypothetical protein